MKKSLIMRIKFALNHPYESVYLRIRNWVLDKKGIDFKPEFDLFKLGLPDTAHAYESLDGRNLKHIFKELNKTDKIV